MLNLRCSGSILKERLSEQGAGLPKAGTAHMRKTEMSRKDSKGSHQSKGDDPGEPEGEERKKDRLKVKSSSQGILKGRESISQTEGQSQGQEENPENVNRPRPREEVCWGVEETEAAKAWNGQADGGRDKEQKAWQDSVGPEEPPAACTPQEHGHTGQAE